MDVAALDTLSDAEAETEFARTCGARRWIQAMVAARPFGDTAHLAAAAERAFDALTDADWREAFAHHPRIGDVSRLRARFAGSGELSEREQGDALRAAHEAVLEQLLAANQRYEARHGHLFIVCASGKTAAEMLGLLLARENLEPAAELRTCALEQRKITRLRLGVT